MSNTDEKRILAVENLSKDYLVGGKVASQAVKDISFDVRPGEFFTLLGPSGCGKTTTLRSIAGLEKPSQGTIRIGEETVFDSARRLSAPTHRRNIGMVFQSYAVWPHMTVFDNVAFPLKQARRKRPDASGISERVAKMLDVVGLSALRDRSASQLSGGQQQRLSLARALVCEPRLLLLDEPLSNLDAVLRDQMRSELRRLQSKMGIASLYVTHDQAEALALSDRIAVFSSGRIVQIGTPKEIYYQPRSQFVASFIGSANLLPGRLSSKGDGDCVVETGIGPVRCRCLDEQMPEDVVVMIRPETLRLIKCGSGDPEGTNRFHGTVTDITFLGEMTEYQIRLTDDLLISQRSSSQNSSFQTGEAVTVEFLSDSTLAVKRD